MNKPEPQDEGDDRLDAWYDGAAICVIAVGKMGDPLDLGEEEVEVFITKLQKCLRESRSGNERHGDPTA